MRKGVSVRWPGMQRVGGHPRTWVFFGRRLSPRDYPGRPLTVGLVLGLAALGTFGLIAGNVVGQTSLVQFDEALDRGLRHPAIVTPTADLIFGAVSQLGSPPAIGGLAGAAALALFLGGQRWLALGIVLAVLLGGGLDDGLKAVFRRPRPLLPKASLRHDSFPSGHALCSMIVYGLLGYLLVLFPLRHRWTRVAAVVLLAGTVLLIGFSRLYLRRHFFSDVAGGFAAGMAWLAFWITGLEAVRRCRRSPPSEGPTEPPDAAPVR
jgi:membrane-associated phospholipid phosphatase